MGADTEDICVHGALEVRVLGGVLTSALPISNSFTCESAESEQNGTSTRLEKGD